MTQTKRAGFLGTVGQTLRHEPLIHFFALASLLFLANAVFSDDDREVIKVDAATRDYLLEQRQSLLLRDMTDEEKSTTIKNFIDEEILVREAQKRGFANSSSIRSLLIQNMRFFLTSELPDPSEKDLRVHFEANRAQFAGEPTVSYEHVFYSDPQKVSDDTLTRLRTGSDHTELGDTNLLISDLSKVGERQVVATFGREQASIILAIHDDWWHGPFNSPNGVHFLRIVERHPGTRPTFEDANHWLEQDWRLAQARLIVAREIVALQKNYRIEVENERPQ